MPRLWQGDREVIELAQATGLPFHAVLKMLRVDKGLSARALSLACDLSPSYISKLESGTNKPTIDTFIKIARELTLNETEILFLLGCE